MKKIIFRGNHPIYYKSLYEWACLGKLMDARSIDDYVGFSDFLYFIYRFRKLTNRNCRISFFITSPFSPKHISDRMNDWNEAVIRDDHLGEKFSLVRYNVFSEKDDVSTFTKKSELEFCLTNIPEAKIRWDDYIALYDKQNQKYHNLEKLSLKICLARFR